MKEFIIYIVTFFEWYSFFYVIFRKKIRKLSRQGLWCILLCLIMILLCIVGGWNLGGDVTPFSELQLFVTIILYCIFEASVVEMIGLVIGEWLVLSILETTLQVSAEYFHMGQFILEIMIMLIISMCLWLYYLVIGKRLERDLFQLSIKMWYLLDLIMLILTAMMEFFSYIIVEELPKGKMTMIGKGLSIVGGDLIILLLFVMIYFFNQTKNLQLQKNLEEIKSEQQKEYFLQLLRKEDETKRFRHDIINDLLELRNYCEQKECDKLMSYLESTIGVVCDINKSSYDVGNDIVNTVLNYYLQSVRDKYEIEINGYVNESISIEQRDLCTVCANLIKNAVEAVEQLEYGKIIFDINQGTKYLSVKVVNSFDGKLNLEKNGLPKTTKKDAENHGIGLQNVKQIVQRYAGRYSIDVRDGLYQIDIFLALEVSEIK